MISPIPAAEVEVDAGLVRRLLRDQHPDLAERRLQRIGTGWDTEVFRLGADLTVRVPRRELGARAIETELRWVPQLAGALPLPVPTPLRAGGPTDYYPWRWAVCVHVPGRVCADVPFTGHAGQRAAATLAGFLHALHVPAPAQAPRSAFRGVPLDHRSESVAAALPSLPRGLRGRVARVWDEALGAGDHTAGDVWLHGDLHGLNVLATRGRISGVIDFGDLCAGDPATDLASAWLLLDSPGREQMRAALDVDDAAWMRGRGWAAFFGLMFVAHSADSPINASIGHRALGEVCAGRV
jgi:aminoglycoside phosphotransferase (APT) family kinase protein